MTGLEKPSRNLFNDYLPFRKQTKKIRSSYSDWANVTRGITRRPILGSLLFNISSMIFSYLLKNLIYTNLLMITPCAHGLNSLIVNPEKFQFMILQKSLLSKYCLTIGPIKVKASDHEEFLGITVDKHLDFKMITENLCWNTN